MRQNRDVPFKRVRHGWSIVRTLAVIAGFAIVLGATLQMSPIVAFGQAPQHAAGDANASESVKAHLSAGEYVAALRIAESVADAKERAQLIKMIVEAQVKTGAFDAALNTIRQMPGGAQQARAFEERAAARSMEGGSMADFSELMDLIQNETTGPWADIDGTGGTMDSFDQGVRVDPKGLLAMLTHREQSARLKEMGITARQADLNEDIARPSELRLVSLTRLEREIGRRLVEGQPVVETMKKLAGLYAVRYVFVYPETNEIVIGGPAEGWRYTKEGSAVGADSGRPTLQLDDLVTLLRTFSPGGHGVFGCSINPRQEGLKQLREFVMRSQARGPLMAGAPVRNWVNQLQKQLGEQDIEIYGVPADTRVARIIVEADYRMKLIGIDKMDGGPGIPSFFDLLTVEEQKSATLDALRWWLTMKYDAVLHSPNRNVFEIQGASVLCQSENQFITAQGQQVQTGKAEATNRLFAENFTNHYGELASRDLVFAELQNVFDLALVAALLHEEKVPSQLKWDLGVFAKGGAYELAQYHAPRTVDSVVNHRVYRGRDIVVQVAGGVRADLMTVVRDPSIVRSVTRLQGLETKNAASELPEGRWWWDAAH